MKRVGIIGLGCIGRGMAKNLLKAGFPLTAYDINKEALQAVMDMGATAGTNPKDVAEKSDVVISIVLNIEQTEAISLGPEGVLAGLRPGGVLVLSSTIPPKRAAGIAEIGKEKGIHVIDAPLSGGNNGAENGTLTLMVGGPKAVFDQVKDVLDAIGKNIIHIAEEVGTGLIVKATNQVVTHVSVVALAEGLVFGARAGIDPDLLFEILTNCTANSYMWQDRVPSILKRDFTCRGSLDIQVKDLAICLEMGKDMQLPLFLSAASQQVYLMAQSMGLGGEDLGAVVKVYEEYAKMVVQGTGNKVPMPDSLKK